MGVCELFKVISHDDAFVYDQLACFFLVGRMINEVNYKNENEENLVNPFAS